MTTDRDLDRRLADAALVWDADLPPLPRGLLGAIRVEAEGAPADLAAPASMAAARQRVDGLANARSGGRRGRGHPVRRRLVAAGAVGLVAAATVSTLVLVDSSGGDRTPSADRGATASSSPSAPVDPPGGLTLVAAEEVTFPYSLDPVPAGLTPVFTRWGGTEWAEGHSDVLPLHLNLAYESATDTGFGVSIYPTDPRVENPDGSITARPLYAEEDVVERRTVSVDGTPAEFVRAVPATPICSPMSLPAADGTFQQRCLASFANLFWTRGDGSFAWVSTTSEIWETADALVAVAETVVDRPQPVPLQLRLAPEGWEVSQYDSRNWLTLATPADPTSSDNQINLNLYQDPALRGRDPVETHLEVLGNVPVESVTVQGRPAALAATGPDSGWSLLGLFADGTLFRLDAPATLSRDDVLAMANSATYTP